MKNLTTHYKECLVYPGEYIPLPEVESLWKEILTTGKEPAAKPLVNVDEYSNSIKVEFMLGGIKREDIIIDIRENILSILVLHKCKKETKKALQPHEFETECMERHIMLPATADTEFLAAEYREGILSIYIPKTHKQVTASQNQIVVY